MLKERLEMRKKQQIQLNTQWHKLIEEEKNATDSKTKMLSKFGQKVCQTLEQAI